MKVQEITTNRGPMWLLLDDNHLVVDAVARFLRHVKSAGKSPYTLKAYAYDLLLYFNYLSIVSLSYQDICDPNGDGPADILSAFLLWLQYPSTATGTYVFGAEEAIRKNSSVNRIMSTVLDFYRYLAANKELEDLNVYHSIMARHRFRGVLGEMVGRKKKITSNIFKMPTPERDVCGITREQYEELLKHTNNIRDRVLLGVLYECGLRIGEALGLMVVDIQNISDREISVVSRNNKNLARVKRHSDRKVYLPKYLANEILNYITTDDFLEMGSDYLFVNLTGPNRGKPMSFGAAEALFDRLSKRVGYNLHPHMLRHGFTEEKLKSGMFTIVDLMMLLGHKSIQSTQIYAKDDEETLREKLEENWNEREKSLKNVREQAVN